MITSFYNGNRGQLMPILNANRITENKKKYVCIEGYEIEVSVLPRLKMTIEDLSNDWNHIELTDSAIKQIGL